MFSNVFTLTLRQRFLGTLIASVAVTAIVVMGVSVYAGIGDQLTAMLEKMPDAMIAAMGMTKDADPTTFALAEIVNLMAPLVVCGLAISMGTASIAGEEAQNTLSVLLGNPRSRTQILLAKLAAMTVLSVVAGILIGAGVRLSLDGFGSTATVHVAATMTHMVALALFFGAFAALVGALTGLQPIATAASVVLLIVSWLGASLIPMFPSADWVANFLPWHYFSGSHPLHEGANATHIAILGGLAVACGVGAFFSIRARDLKFGDGSTLLDQIKRHPIGAKVFDKLGGGGLVQNITLRTVSESQTIALMVAFYTALMAALMGPLFTALADVLKGLSEAFPKALMAVVGFADMSTPEGWYIAEVYSLVAPGVVIFVGALMGTKALAGEEAARTMGMLLANPVARWRVLIEKAIAIEIVLAIVAFGVFAGTVAGNFISDLNMSVANIAAASVHTFAIGVFFGMLALAAGAVTGRRSIAIYVVTGTALVSWAFNAFMPVDPSLAKWAKLSPLYYYFGNNPLLNGIEWSHLGVLFGGAAAFVALGVAAFDRRDLRG